MGKVIKKVCILACIMICSVFLCGCELFKPQVYACDNDVVDHQVVNIEFKSGCTVSFSMNSFNEGGRNIRIFGTKGEITADMEAGTIALYSFETKGTTRYNVGSVDAELTGGHGGGDTEIMIDMVKKLNRSV